jgi:phosphoglycolate phosphatase-like HAD superfamily hydrolase
MILYARDNKKVYIREDKISLFHEGLDVTYNKDKNIFNTSVNNSKTDVDNQGVDTRLFGTRNDILNGDGSIEQSRMGKPGRKTHAFMQSKLGKHYKETTRMYRDVVNFVRNFDRNNVKNIYTQFNKAINLASYDMIESGPKTAADKIVYSISKGEPINSALSKLLTNLNNAERAAAQYEKPLQNSNDERFASKDRIPRYRMMKVPFTNVDVISLFRMVDFNFSDIIKHGYIRANDKNLKTFGIDADKREKIQGKTRAYKPFEMNYDGNVTPNIGNNFSLNGSEDLSRKKYGYEDNGYTSIAEFIDKSIMGASYALKCESFIPSLIIDAPSSSKFNLFYCTRLSNKLGVPYEHDFFKRDMINVSMDEEMMRNDGIEEEQIISFRETAKQKGISEIVYFMGEPINEFFNEYGKYFTDALGNKIAPDRILLILKEWSLVTYFENASNGDNLLEYFKNNVVSSNSHIKLSSDYKLHQKEVHKLLYSNYELLQKFMRASKKMIEVFNIYKERLLTTGVKIDFSLQRGKIVDFGGKYRKYVKNMYIVANKHAVNDPQYFERLKNKKYLLFDEDISTGSTLKLLINALHNNGVNDSNIMCLTNAYSLSESVGRKNVISEAKFGKKIRGVIFDFDYTLFNTDGTLEIRRWARTVKGTPKDRKMAWAAVSKQADKNIIYPGIRELISYLESNGIAWAVVTKCNQQFAKETISLNGLSPLCIKGDRSGWLKSSLMREVLGIMGLSPQECLSIGDRVSDGTESAKLGIPFIGCSWGDGIDQDRISNGVKSPSEIISYIENINKKGGM